MKRRLRWALSGAIALHLIGACADDATPDARYADPELDLGAQVYADKCAVCHGTNGAGGVGPAVGGGAVVVNLPDVAEHRDVVANGRNTMPAWRGVLSDEEIDAVVRYQREELGR